MTISPRLSPTAQMIQDVLEQTDFACRVIEFAESTRTAHEAADRVGCALGQIIKLLIFRGMETYLDEDFFQYPTLWAAAGTPNAVFELTPADLQ